jgi:hypothetical protein
VGRKEGHAGLPNGMGCFFESHVCHGRVCGNLGRVQVPPGHSGTFLDVLIHDRSIAWSGSHLSAFGTQRTFSIQRH